MRLRIGRCLLQNRMDEAGITQVELSERLGITQPMISHYANNRRIMSLTVAKNISDVLNCNVEELYSWEPNLLKRKGH